MPQAKAKPAPDEKGQLFALIAGLAFALVLTKGGIPIVVEHVIPPPGNFMEVITDSWPSTWNLMILLAVGLAAGLCARFDQLKPGWAFWAPAAWMGWQVVSSLRTVDMDLSVRTIRHLGAAAICFYVGWLALGRVKQSRLFWLGLLGGFVVMLAAGVRQQSIELEQMRVWVAEQEKTLWMGPDVTQEKREEMLKQQLLVPVNGGFRAHPEFLKRVEKGRVSGTFGYPNALAGAILMLLPAMLAALWEMMAARPPAMRKGVVGVLGAAALACLFWSGSKSGWLVAMGMGVLTLLRMPLAKGLKVGIVAAMVVCGGAGFAWKFADYFKKGATSVGARMACWKVALQVAGENPLLGTGPGTFGRNYERLKAPDAEMARLAHNDYLEQATDSGWPGFVAFLVILPGSLAFLYRGSSPKEGVLRFAVWLGLVGWAVQEGVEFGLYIPALGWTAFLLLGWLWGTRERSGIGMDKKSPAG